MNSNLTEDILLYKRTGKGFEEILRTISIEVYKFPQVRFRWDEDLSGDFFCYFLPRIPGLIKRFTFTGKPFEVYLVSCMKWQMKTFLSKQIRDDRRRRVIEHISATDAYSQNDYEDCGTEVDEEEPYIPLLKSILKIDSKGNVPEEPFKRRLLYLALSSCEYVSEHIVIRISIMTGIPKLKIEELMKALDERMGKTRARLRMLQTRRNSHYFRIVYVHEELSRNPDREKRLNLMEELKEEKRKFERTCEELRNLQAGPSHRDIAEVMGIPKGSVDSGIYYIRHAYLRFSEREFRESEERKIA
ncbi:MAG TPA: hypothetical protein PLG43_12190 [Spirochaetia bacterium]|mgnify:CR=1 FL=1|nr:hypothetical protein [Spirochaetia bacterium]